MAQGSITHRPAWAQYQRQEELISTEERPDLPNAAARSPQPPTVGKKASRIELDADGFVVAINGRAIVQKGKAK